MFKDLNLSEFTWRREPILYLALFLALGNIVHSVLTGGVGIEEAIQSAVVLLVGFFGRGQVTPYP